MSTILLDFESRSRADLKTIGGRLYWQDPSTEVICVVLHEVESGLRVTWLPGDPCPFEPEDVLVAHNAMGFDRFATAALGWRALDAHDPPTCPRCGWTGEDPECQGVCGQCAAFGRDRSPPWVDTSELARVAGLPGSLDALATRWLDMAKDKTGSAVTVSLSRTTVAKEVPAELRPAMKEYHRALKEALATGGEWPEIPPEILATVINYCHSDVDVLVHGWPLLEPWLAVEPDVSRVEREINDRGICFDSALARRLLEEDAQNASDATGLPVMAMTKANYRPAMLALGVNVPRDCNNTALRKKLPTLTGEARRLTEARLYISGLRHAATFCKWVREAGGETESAEYENVEPLTRSPIFAVAELARKRLALASIASGKLRAGLARVSADGRLRDSCRYFGAHTGRWSGRGMQLQNMPRPADRFDKWGDAEVQALAAAVLAGQHATQDEIDLLLRACLHAAPGHVLIWEDFSGVEARWLAWSADDHAALAVFADPKRSPYKEMAAVIFGVDAETIEKGTQAYTIGKAAELACGYQMGPAKFTITAEGAGMTWDAPCHEERPCGSATCGRERVDRKGHRFTDGAHAVVHAWRRLHAPSVALWEALSDAFAAACRGEATRVSCYEFCPTDDGRAVAVVLPSGRPLMYHEPKISWDAEEERETFSYRGAQFREHLYGGKLCENLTQAGCRELLAWAMVRAADAGLPGVLSVHDELVVEVPESSADTCADALHMILTTLPEWAAGFPIGAAGAKGERYRK